MKAKRIKGEEKMKATNVFVTILLVSVVLSLLVGVSGATWCDTNYAKRIDTNVNNTGGAALTDYQVYVNLSANPINETSMRVYNSSDCTSRDFWCEETSAGNCTKLWINYSVVAASAWTNNTAIYYDNVAVSSASNGTNTFEFFDDFEGGTTINETYLTSWTKSGSNPLQDKTCQNWFMSVYSNYSGEDKIYLFEQRDAYPNSSIEAWSFTRANASTPANWTDHGVVFDDSGYFHNEPHGIIFETQSMADAREGVGAGLGTQKWRMYYCGMDTLGDTSTYSANFAYTEESDLTNWTAYASNPVYDHDATWGFADSKVCVYDDKVWLHHCKYKPGTSCDTPFFSVSDNGIDNWTDKTGDWTSEYTIIGTITPFSTGILLTGRTGLTVYNAYFTTDGDDKATYSGNPIIPQGDPGDFDDTYVAWTSIVVDKNGSANLNSAGTYYMYYIGDGGASTYKLGMATSTTLTEESETTSNLDTNKWSSGGNPTISNGELLIDAAPEHIKSVSTFQYKAMKTRVKFPATANSYHYFGFQASASANAYNTESIYSYATPDLKVISGDADTMEITSIYNSAYFGSYHNYEFLWKSGEAKFYIDESLKDTDTTDVCTIANPVGFYDYENAGDLYVDWVLVRKYATPEPSTTLGSEEQQGANPILHIGNAINIKEDWGRDFNSNLSANVTTANASDVWMNFTNAEFTNTSLGDLNLTLDEWVNESHNVNAPVTNVSVDVCLNSTTSGATNDTDSFWYEITKRTNTATMDSAATQFADISETFYINATCNEEYGNSFYGDAALLEDGVVQAIAVPSITDYVNFSWHENSPGQYNYTIRFYNSTHHNNATTPTYSNVTINTTNEYIPSTPANLQNTTGNFWVNHTWIPNGVGNITDSFNISIDVTWYNTTLVTYHNDTGLSAHGWSNITVWAYNNSGNGSLSTGSISDDVQIPNNAVTLTITQNHNKLETETVFISDTSSSDTDSDTPTYSCNRTDLFNDFSTVTGYGNWTTGTSDAGIYYVDIGVSDGWGSTDNKTLTITIGDATPGTPSGLANTTGNFWVNHTWINGVNTDTCNVSVNLSWNNGSSNEYYNNTPLSAHKWSNVSVYGFNSTSGELSSGISQNTQIPNNVPVLVGLPDNTTDEDVNQTDIFDLDNYFTDADGDTPTYLVESNNQSAYVSVTINVSNNVSYTLASGWNGTASVVINVTDGWGGEDNDTFLIVVNAAPLPGDYTPGDPTGLANTTGNYWVNYTWNVGGGNATDSYNVSWNLSWFNGTMDTFMKKEVGASNWANITVYAYNSSGNGTLSSGYLSDEVQAPAFIPGEYTPPNPTTLLNSTGNYYVNYTWVMGVPGNVTDSYNVSWNLSWFNGTLTTYMQKEVGASNWGNITVYAYNSSGNGTLSAGSLSDNVQSPAFAPGDYTPPNPTTLANTTGNYWVNFTWSSGGGANITDSYNVSWNLTWFNNTLTTYMQKDVGASGWANITIYAFNSSGNGSLSTGYISDEVQAPSAPIGDYVPPNPVNLVNSSGNGWVNYTWNSGAGNITDSYNVSWNLTWYNTTLTAYMNDTVGEFGWGNISVWAFNSSGNGSLSAGSISDNTQAEGGTYTTPMSTTVYNLITYYGSATSTAEQFGLDIGDVGYVCIYNGSFYSHTMGYTSNNFTTYHGIGYYVYLNASGSSTYQRNNIPEVSYNTQLFNRWNTIGWTNSTNTDADGLATSIGSACKYTSMLNADGVTYTTHTVGFTSNNHAVNIGQGYWVWTNAGVNWGRNS